jgi:hypothetical protein
MGWHALDGVERIVLAHFAGAGDLAARALDYPTTDGGKPSWNTSKPALGDGVLRQRYARGEIDEATFTRMRAHLEETRVQDDLLQPV